MKVNKKKLKFEYENDCFDERGVSMQDQSGFPYHGCDRLADLSVQCHPVASEGSVRLET